MEKYTYTTTKEIPYPSGGSEAWEIKFGDNYWCATKECLVWQASDERWIPKSSTNVSIVGVLYAVPRNSTVVTLHGRNYIETTYPEGTKVKVTKVE
jgi:hypothetical protein